MLDDIYELGSKKHAFIDWDLVEPGNAVLGDGKPVRLWLQMRRARLYAMQFV